MFFEGAEKDAFNTYTGALTWKYDEYMKEWTEDKHKRILQQIAIICIKKVMFHQQTPLLTLVRTKFHKYC